MSENLQLKHTFFDQSMNVIGLIKKHINKRIGITTSTIEHQAYSVLSKAIQEEIEKQNVDRRILFQNFSIIKNSCETRLKDDILSCALCESINKKERNLFFNKVEAMYRDLTKKAATHPKLATLKAKIVPKFISKKFAYKLYKEQDQLSMKQLTNLLENPVDKIDKIILAEAACLNKLYKETIPDDVEFILVSTDRHFSPYRKEGFESKQVTNEIEKRFGIVCEWPYQVAQELQKTLK